MKLFKRSLFVLCLLFVGALAASCDFGKPVDPVDPGEEKEEELMELDAYKLYVLDDLRYVLKGFKDQVDAATFAKCQKQEQVGEDAINSAKSVRAVKAAYDTAKQNIANVIPLANGLYSYTHLSQAEKTKILGILEAYAVRNGITGISLFENGSYVMYHDRITLGTENYIVGYGFGTLAEGSINAPLDYEENQAWKYYYHTLNANDPGTANYLNDQGSEVGDFYGYIAAGLVTNFMNETKDGYDWVLELAKAGSQENPSYPEAVGGLDATGQAKKWRYEVRVGAELKYNTNSQIESRAAFNGREVALEDYITPFKLLLTQANGLYRGSELANTKEGYAIPGAKAYYDATTAEALSAEGAKTADELWEELGVAVRVYEEEGKSYFEWETTATMTPYYAMYYIASSLYMPIPQEFLDLVTIKNYLGFNADKSETPVDNSLSLGSYTLETWDSDQQVVYKKNPYYVHAAEKYSCQGVHINILPGMNEDPNLSIKEFLAGHTDAAGIPQDYLDEYKDDPRTRQTKGDSNFKLNVNATNSDTWEKLFGVNGSVTQTAREDYWEVEPALSNPHFIRALSYSINRLEFSSKRGSVPSVDYLSSNYMSDGEKGISYSATEEHAAAVERLLEDTVYGYNLELAREYFKMALAELEASGAYKRGTPEEPTVIELEIAWQRPTHNELYHKEIAQYFEEAFNHESVSGGCYKLVTKFWNGDVWSDVYYGKMMIGQFDLGFGSISGNSLNPLGFVSVLSSDQSISGNFTLNWGTDTNDPNADILVYEGMRWSYDSLYMAANAQSIVVRGANQPAFAYSSKTVKSAGGVTVTVTVEHADNCSMSDLAVVLYGYEGENYNEYEIPADALAEGTNVTIEEVEGAYKLTVVLPYEEYSWINPAKSFGLDIYAATDVFGIESDWDYLASVGADLDFSYAE